MVATQLEDVEINSISKDFIIPIYKFKFKLVICRNIKEYTDSINYFYINGTEAAVVLNFTDDTNYNVDAILIFTPQHTKLNLIAHECFHLTHLVMNSVGCKYNDGSEEAYAYLLDYLVKLIGINIIKLKQELQNVAAN